jgi:hypothetical protein
MNISNMRVGNGTLITTATVTASPLPALNEGAMQPLSRGDRTGTAMTISEVDWFTAPDNDTTKIIDGLINNNSKCEINGGALVGSTLTIDFGQILTVNKFGFFANRNVTLCDVNIDVSDDQVTWTNVANNATIIVRDYIDVSATAQPGRYFRLTTVGPMYSQYTLLLYELDFEFNI